MRYRDFVDVEKAIPGIQVQLIYATDNNFVNRAVYPIARCFLRKKTADKLLKVQQQLSALKLGLKIFDGYRPLSVQKIFWDLTKDRNYVADPAIGSKHNRGAAVDVTLVTCDKKELIMPTKVDEMSPRAHRDFDDLPSDVIANRLLLESVMVSAGFVPLPHEWWHFDDSEWQQYPIEDIGLEELSARV